MTPAPGISTPRRFTAQASASTGWGASCSVTVATASCCRPRWAVCSSRCRRAPTRVRIRRTRSRSPRCTTTASTAPCARSKTACNDWGSGKSTSPSSTISIRSPMACGGHRQRYREAMEGAYPALARLRNEGVVKAIGVGVNDWRVCQRCAKAADFDCFLLAGRYSLLEQEALKSFLPLCERKGIGVIVGAPYNSGILARGAVELTTHNYQAPSPEILREGPAHGANLRAIRGQPGGGGSSVSARAPGGRVGYSGGPKPLASGIEHPG